MHELLPAIAMSFALADETGAAISESGEGSNAMTGACPTVSQVQSIPRAAALSSASLLLVTFRWLSRRLNDLDSTEK
jgi:hypothetical protein